MTMGYGLIGLIVLVLDLWGVVNVTGSGATTGMKLFWVLLIVILPVGGLIVWFMTGPRSAWVVA